MKSIALIVFGIVLLSGCKLFPEYEIDPPDLVSELATADSRLEKLDIISNWMYRNIQYKKDREVWGVDDYWMTPEETYHYRVGDCEDISILFAYFAFRYTGEEPILLIVDLGNGERHMGAVCDDYEFYLFGDYTVIIEHTLKNALFLAENVL